MKLEDTPRPSIETTPTNDLADVIERALARQAATGEVFQIWDGTRLLSDEEIQAARRKP